MKHQLIILSLILLALSGCAVVVSAEPFEEAAPAPAAALPVVPPSPTPYPTPTEAVESATPEPSPTPSPVLPTETPTTAVTALSAPLMPTSTLPPAGQPAAATPTPAPPTPTPLPTATPVPPTPTATVAPQMIADRSVETTSAMAPTVRETTITLNTAGYQQALVATQPGDPVYPYPRLNHDAVGPAAPKNYRAIILENRYTQLTILPDLGGRIYRWVDKSSGRSLFYENPVVKPTSWGNRGWWLAAGGMEWALPTDEHGLSEASPWEVDLYQNPAEASVTVRDTEENSGLVSEINIALDAEHAYFTLTPRLINPTDHQVAYKFWMNAMLNLGSKRPGQGFKFVLPTEMVTVHSTGDNTLPAANQPMTWPTYDGRNLADYGNWQNHLGVFASPAAQDDFMGAYNHDTQVGVARVFPHQLARGAKIFAPGDLDPALWTTDGSGYVELWGGLAPTFADTTALEPGAWVTWQERWYAIGDMGGFSMANTEAALNLGVLADSVQVAAATTHPINGILLLWHNNEEATRWPLTIYPETPFRGSFASSTLKGGEWGLSLFDRNGQELAALGQTLPTLPSKAQSAEAIPASAQMPANTPTATATPALATPTPQPTASAYPTATPEPTRVTLVWDERLADLDIKLVKGTPEPEQPIFRLVSAKYLNEWESGGLHHVFVEVLDEQGQRIVGQPVALAWADGKTLMMTEDKPAPEFAANSPLYGEMEEGTYKAYVDGAPSDIVTGLGLPGKHHVSYQLTFQRNVQVAGEPATPVPTVQPTSTPAAPANGGGSGSGIKWDSRLDAMGITLKKATDNGNPVYRLVSAVFQDDSESGGMHHVFVEVLNEKGQRLVGQNVTMAWADGKTTMVTEDKPYPEYAANAPMFGPMDQGTYKVYVDVAGTDSDVISGLGLPGNHHVNYLLTFQRQN